MQKKRTNKIVAMFMVILMTISVFGNVTVFAAESKDSEIIVAESKSENNNGISMLAGTETLPLGWYTISQSFTVTNNNLSPVKTVSGRYMKLKFSWMVATSDQGVGGAIVTIRLVDPSSGDYITVPVTSSVSDKWVLTTFEVIFDLGYANRQIQIFTDVSSNGTSNGHYRSATFYDYQTYVYN